MLHRIIKTPTVININNICMLIMKNNNIKLYEKLCNFHGLQQKAVKTLTLNVYFFSLSRAPHFIFVLSFSFQEKKKEKFFSLFMYSTRLMVTTRKVSVQTSLNNTVKAYMATHKSHSDHHKSSFFELILI